MIPLSPRPVPLTVLVLKLGSLCKQPRRVTIPSRELMPWVMGQRELVPLPIRLRLNRSREKWEQERSEDEGGGMHFGVGWEGSMESKGIGLGLEAGDDALGSARSKERRIALVLGGWAKMALQEQLRPVKPFDHGTTPDSSRQRSTVKTWCGSVRRARVDYCVGSHKLRDERSEQQRRRSDQTTSHHG